MPLMGCTVAGSYVNKFLTMTFGPIVIIGAMQVASMCGCIQSIRVRRNTVYLLFLAYPACGSSSSIRLAEIGGGVLVGGMIWMIGKCYTHARYAPTPPHCSAFVSSLCKRFGASSSPTAPHN